MNIQCRNKQFSCYLDLHLTRRMLVAVCFLFKNCCFPQQPIPQECTGYSTPSGAGVWKGRDFLDMHIYYCSQFVLLSKDLGCVKMHCLLFAKVCCYFSLQTATVLRPPQNNLNFTFQCQAELGEWHQSIMSLLCIISPPGCQSSGTRCLLDRYSSLLLPQSRKVDLDPNAEFWKTFFCCRPVTDVLTFFTLQQKFEITLNLEVTL